MKKINFKSKTFWLASAAVVSVILLTVSIVSFAKNANSKNAQPTSSEENLENSEVVDANIANEGVNEEIDINSLENVAEENNVVNENSQTKPNTKPSTSSSKGTSGSSSNKTYYIKVNYGANVVTIYKKDADGNYTVPVKAMVCSTGTATPKSGTYKIQGRWEWLGLIGNVYGHYSTQIVGNILFHSVPYLKKWDPASLEYWEYDKLGTSCSAGCIRLTIADAKWIYNNVARGTIVEFYSSSNPGPLGKPSARKISGNVACRNWDPTDTTSGNPWHSYDKENSPTPTTPSVNPAPVTNKVPDNNTSVENNTPQENNVIDNNTSTNNTVIENNSVLDNNPIVNNATSDNNTVVNNSKVDNNTVVNNVVANNNSAVNNEKVDNNAVVNNDASDNNSAINNNTEKSPNNAIINNV